ncbi:hypothetical protein DPMN_031422 [Dreissena polymorpha]|uniref:Uncharacterized protein n=1 Tax=Dreissena polymorpha TaxID=45954 RepID=A0A9D4M266_DREPO|nr:hypothetical protein DPMN_031422 [Dreissena polymorpha]
MEYMQTAMIDMGMYHVHMDMQLFAVTKQVSWHHLERFKNVVVHPGGMHIIQLFLSCIGKLMKGSALECYVDAEYGGLTGICNGKAWVKAMRAYRGVAVALLKNFMATGPKSFEQIEEYLETARSHPTGRHRVDNFLMPTLLVHQFESAEREGYIDLKLVVLKRLMNFFFLAGHAQYSRYLSQYLLDVRTEPAAHKVDLVCRHRMGSGIQSQLISLGNKLPYE